MIALHTYPPRRIASILLTLLATLLLTLGTAATAQIQEAQSTRRVVVEPVPSVHNIYRVVATKTPSGFEVPRYVSLKFNTINGRSGPSQKHPILWQYRRAGLPVIIVAETENWRKIRDMGGDESWIYKAGLSGERHVVVLRETPVKKHADTTAKTIAIADKNTVLRLEKCENGWCRVFSGDGHRGWVTQYSVWGTTALYE